jgi:hypothetical protein
MTLVFEEVYDDDEEEVFNPYLALEQYRDLTMELGTFNRRRDELKKQLVAWVKETGEKLETEGAYAKISSGYTRTVVDTKPFLEWCEAHPHSEACQFVVEKEYAPGVQIKVGM